MKKLLLISLLSAGIFTNCGKHLPSQPAAETETAKLLSDWITLQLRLVRSTTGLTHVAYSRTFSYPSIAFYESLVPGERDYRSLASQLNGLGSLPAAPQFENVNYAAAANAAYAAMMRNFYSGNSLNPPLIDSLESAWNSRFATSGSSSSANSAGASFGKSIAQALITWSLTDNANKASLPYTPPVGDGLWTPTPPALAAAASPYWGNNQPMVAHSTDGAMAPPPIPFSTEPNTPFYNMVKRLYDTSQTLSADRKAQASFWDDSPNGKYVTAFGHWSSILIQIIANRHLKGIIAAQAYATMAISLNDVSIICWKGKYKYSQLRPVTYIRRYLGDSAWLSFITNPAHPEYPAAHACLSAAAAEALTLTLGDGISFTDHTYDAIAFAPRSFPDFLAAAKDAGSSRFYGGIHFMPSIEAGYTVGKTVANSVVSRLQFQRKSSGKSAE